MTTCQRDNYPTNCKSIKAPKSENSEKELKEPKSVRFGNVCTADPDPTANMWMLMQAWRYSGVPTKKR